MNTENLICLASGILLGSALLALTLLVGKCLRRRLRRRRSFPHTTILFRP